MVVFCPACKAYVDAKSLESYACLIEEEGPRRFSLLYCPKCSRPFLAQEHGVFLDDYNEHFRPTLEPQLLFPASVSLLASEIPERVARSYKEASGCLQTGHFVATAMMCRKTLESLCAEHAMAGANLASKLKRMRDDGLIDKRLYEWAEALRIAGNEAVHDVDVNVSQQDAQDLVDFTRALLDYLFTFRQKFESFMRRRTEATIGKIEPEGDLPF